MVVKRPVGGRGGRGADPFARRIRERRAQKGLNLRQLAREAGIPSASHLFYIERGLKVPNEEYAARLARALGDDEELYRAWARLRSRGRSGRVDPRTMYAAMVKLSEEATLWSGEAMLWSEEASLRSKGATLLADAALEAATGRRFAGPLPEAQPVMTGSSLVLGGPIAAAPPAPRLKIPVLEPGSDPGDDVVPTGRILDYLRIPADFYLSDPERARKVLESLRRPFAYRLTTDQARRAPRLAEGSYAIISRNSEAWQPPQRIEPREAYAVRAGGVVELVSGEALLSAGAIPAELARQGLMSPEDLRARVIGKVEFELPDKL